MSEEARNLTYLVTGVVYIALNNGFRIVEGARLEDHQSSGHSLLRLRCVDGTRR